MADTDKVRIDKWLWSVRIYKSRSLATDACKAGNVAIDGTRIKPSHAIQGGEMVKVRKDGFNLTYRVLNLIDKRVGAPIAITCYEDLTPEEERNKYEAWFAVKHARPEHRIRGAGRPTKKERRIIDDFKDVE